MELFGVLVCGFMGLIVGIVTGVIIEGSGHDRGYRKLGYCPSRDDLKKEAETKKDEVERVLGG